MVARAGKDLGFLQYTRGFEACREDEPRSLRVTVAGETRTQDIFHILKSHLHLQSK